jgi:hypothetical protein
MAAPQNLSNHARVDRPMHLFVFPVLIANLGVAIWIAIHFRHDYPWLGHWSIVVSLALLILTVKCRTNDLKLQDRIIRLEERLRFNALLPSDTLPHVEELTIRQIVALRFASDHELPALTHRALTQQLEPKAIKQAIANWRADHHRV